MSFLDFSICDCNIRVECTDPHAESLLLGNYGRLRRAITVPQITYQISREQGSKKLLISRNGEPADAADDDGEFLYMVEKDITIEVQKLRSHLYFLHAAVLELNGYGLALVAPSGSGKSTTAWGLLHHGFRYVTDELAPVDLRTMLVYPFPHALCLKTSPPANYPLPDSTIYTAYTAHVPAESLPANTTMDLVPLNVLMFVGFTPEISAPVINRIQKAEGAMRLFTNALNPLAHPADGLEGAIEIASAVRCFELISADLQQTCELVKSTLAEEVRNCN